MTKRSPRILIAVLAGFGGAFLGTLALSDAASLEKAFISGACGMLGTAVGVLVAPYIDKHITGGKKREP